MVAAPIGTRGAAPCGSLFRGTEGYVNPHSWNNVRVCSTDQHQPRTRGRFGSNAFVRDADSDNLESGDVNPVTLDLDQVGIFTLECRANESSFYFSLHVRSSQDGCVPDLVDAIGLNRVDDVIFSSVDVNPRFTA